MDNAFIAERTDVAYFMRRLYELRLTTTSGGNVSCRAGDDACAITPSAVDKARITADQVAIIALDGTNRTPELTASSETAMHLRIYERLPEVGAIVHAHSPTVSAFVCAETPIRVDLLSETYALLDEPLMVPYARTGTDELADLVARYAERSSCLLLRNHAATTTGRDLLQAFNRMELLEDAARITLMVRQLDGVTALTPDHKRALDELMGR